MSFFLSKMENANMSIIKGHLDALLSVLPYAKTLVLKGVGSRNYETAAIAHSMRAYSNFLITFFDDLMEIKTFELLDEREAILDVDQKTPGYITYRYPFKADAATRIATIEVRQFEFITDYMNKFIDAMKLLSSRANTFPTD